MTGAVYRKGAHTAGIAAFLLVLLFYYGQIPPLGVLVPGASLSAFKTVFIGIVLEALPYMLLGVGVSSLVQLFVTDEAIRRFVPRSPPAGVLFACALGIVFPLCECGMLPVVRRLIRKGMPAYVGMVFLVAGPVLNPVVYAATYTAFRSRPEMAYARMGLALAVAVTLGLLLYRFLKRSPLRESSDSREHRKAHGLAFDRTRGQKDSNEHGHAHHSELGHTRFWPERVSQTLFHAADEFFEMGKYLILGAMIAALFQTAVDRESLSALGQGSWSSHLFMLALAYVLSLCSTSDAFVASSFAATFTKGSLLTFLVFGPMMDLKGTVMLLSVFRTRVVIALLLLTGVLVLAGSMAVERFIFQG